MKIVPLPIQNPADIAGSLRILADNIESGLYGDVHGLAWVMNSETGLEVGLIGASTDVTPVTHYLLSLGVRKLETLTE